MDNASDSDSEDCRFDSGRAGQQRDAAPNTLPNSLERVFYVYRPKILVINEKRLRPPPYGSSSALFLT